MTRARFFIAFAVASLMGVSASWFTVPTGAQSPARVIRQAVVADDFSASSADVRSTDQLVESMLDVGELRLREVRDDPLVPERTHQRLQQFYRGIPVAGGEVVRQLDRGQLISAFGYIYPNIDLSGSPNLSIDGVIAAVQSRGLLPIAGDQADLMILPMESGIYVLAYRLRVESNDGTSMIFADANDGSVVMELSDRRTQSAVGQGTGVLGDTKKISTSRQAGTFVSQDQLRPPELLTYDLLGNVSRVDAFLRGQVALGTADLGSKSDNVWTDGGVVDAHVHEGWVYDYYFKRFGRRGLDNNNVRIRGIVHPVRLADYNTASASTRANYYFQAFYSDGCKCMVYGEGLPAGVTIQIGTGRFGARNLAGALDVIAHELTHAVTAASSNLTYLNESGGLNEAFSDIMGTSVEFFYQPVGSGPLQADYLVGEDILTPFNPSVGLRSLRSPFQFGDPDHYGLRSCIGATRDCDSGGVHTNSGIANQAFYLAIEGGANRVSGRSVQGVGAANREQIEKVFYRAFTSMLPSGATFFVARTATIQSARDLYSAGSAVERAVTQAWDAVGVSSPGAALTTRFGPAIIPASNAVCAGGRPSFSYTATVSEFQNVGFTVSNYQIGFYDASFNLLNVQTLTAQSFASSFASCGPGRTRIPGASQACQNACVYLGGRSSGFALYLINGADDNGNVGSFFSNYLVLGAGPITNSFVAGASGLDMIAARAGRDAFLRSPVSGGATMATESGAAMSVR